MRLLMMVTEPEPVLSAPRASSPEMKMPPPSPPGMAAVGLASAGGHAGRPIEHFVEADDVVGDQAVRADALVADAAAAAAAEVAQDVVVPDLVAGGAGEDADAARAVHAAVLQDLVVLDGDVRVVIEGAQRGVHADGDAADEAALVADDPVVADPEIVGLVEDADAAAGNRAFDLETVDARGGGREACVGQRAGLARIVPGP